MSSGTRAVIVTSTSSWAYLILILLIYLGCPQIFNSSFGPSEGEEAERIVFYHPPTDSDELKCKSVGFAEASVRFADAFFADDDNGNGSGNNLRSCHTQVSLSFLS